jgi:NTP pyrophosphatase (non-canonical NTP hydrolase)
MITLADIFAHVEELMAAQGWKPDTPERQLAFLISEVGEVAREVLLLSGGHAPANTPEAEAIRERLGMELFDVIWNACALATLTGVDLETCSARKIAMNRNRTWTP